MTVLTFDNALDSMRASAFWWQLENAEWYHRHKVPRAKIVLIMPLFARTLNFEILDKGILIRNASAHLQTTQAPHPVFDRWNYFDVSEAVFYDAF